MASNRGLQDDSEEEYNGADEGEEEDEDFDGGAQQKKQKRKSVFVDDAAEDDGDAVQILHLEPLPWNTHQCLPCIRVVFHRRCPFWPCRMKRTKRRTTTMRMPPSEARSGSSGPDL
jgi:hypothetical protein